MFIGAKTEPQNSASLVTSPKPVEQKSEPFKLDPEVEKQVLIVLCDLEEELPCDSNVICEKTSKQLGREANIDLVENLLQKFAAQQMIV